MQYDDQGVLLDQAPYPAVYEYKSQQQFEFDHPERMRAIHQLAREQMLQAKLRMKEMANQNRPHRSYEVVLRMGQNFTPDQVFDLIKQAKFKWTITAQAIKTSFETLPISWYEDLAQEIKLLKARPKKSEKSKK